MCLKSGSSLDALDGVESMEGGTGSDLGTGTFDMDPPNWGTGTFDTDPANWGTGTFEMDPPDTMDGRAAASWAPLSGSPASTAPSYGAELPALTRCTAKKRW